MIVILVYATNCLILAARGHGQTAAWLLVPVAGWLAWQTAHWAYRRGWWEPGDGRAESRDWGGRW